MNMNWLECLVYGLISGFTEFVPVSSHAHQTIVLHLFGNKHSYVLQLLLHIGMLAALYMSMRGKMLHLNREVRLANIPRKRRRRNPDPQALFELSALKVSAVTLMAGYLFYPAASFHDGKLQYIALFLLINGIILYAPQFFSTGNKAARTMSRLDSVLIGLGAVSGMFPGISTMAAMTSMSSVRGADRTKALDMCLLLYVPILACLIGFDIRGIFLIGSELLDVGLFISYLCGAIAAFAGTMISVSFVRFLAVRAGYIWFAFYSWGAALFAFILYLT